MTWDFFNTAAGAASLMGLIIAVILGVFSWRSTRATDRLIRAGDARTQEILAQVHAETQRTLDRMDERADARHQQVVTILRELRGDDV